MESAMTNDIAHPYAHRASYIQNQIDVAQKRFPLIWVDLGAKIASLPAGLSSNGIDANRQVQNAAAEEATLELWLRVGAFVERGEPIALAMQYVVDSTLDEVLANGADDKWSGRANDIQRIRFDARRQWVQRQRRVAEK